MNDVAKLLQKDLDAEVKSLLKTRVVAPRQMNSAAATYIGNFLVCKSCIKDFLQQLGYKRGFKVVALGRLYTSVTNFAEIILAIYYLSKLDKKTFRSLGSSAQEVIDRLGVRFPLYYPVEAYIKFRTRLFGKRQSSMGVVTDSIKQEKDKVWLNAVTRNKTLLKNCKEIIKYGTKFKISKAVIAIAVISNGHEASEDFVQYRKTAEYMITKDFVENHYIRSFLSKLECTPEHVSEVLGYNHADLNAMATAYQDDIERILNDTRQGRLFNV